MQSGSIGHQFWIAFSVAVVTNATELVAKANRNLFSHSSEIESPKPRANRAMMAPSGGSREEFFLPLEFLAVTSLQSSRPPPSSPSLLSPHMAFSVCLGQISFCAPLL